MNKTTYRPIRSFIRREGRLTTGQAYALEHQWPLYGLEVANGNIDFDIIFQNHGHRVLEIGYGMGGSLISMAMQMPDRQFIGVEVHKPGVGSLINQAHLHGLTNIKTYADDATHVIDACIPHDHLDTIQIFFPDPWHKRKHHKRRLIQPGFIEQLRQKLKVGGTLHIATDWQHYATHIMSTIESNPLYSNQAKGQKYSPRPEHRPLTKFESRGRQLGHGIWDIIFVRNA